MLVEQLQLAGFRSYRALEVTFPPGPQLIVGPNAAGKTNLLEAIAVLGSGRSHRTTSDVELIAWPSEFARLEAQVRDDSGSANRLELVLARAGSGGRKRVKVNGVPRRASALTASLPLVLFAPEDMLLVIGSPGLRRGAVDGLIAQLQPAAAASTFSTYTRALTQRNNLLRAIRDGLAERAELDYWDAVVCAEGGRIVEWRLDLLARLAEPLAAAHAEIAPGEGRLSVGYVTNAAAQHAETPARALERRLAETSEKELWNGATLVGPHRDDFSFELGGREMAGAASRGQQRSAILAYKLAELELLRARDGRQPLLLLDDVFSELDPQRRAHLVRRIGELPQAFVSTTTLDDLDAALVAASTAWQVRPGELERAA